MVRFSSAWHRNQAFQCYIDNYIHRQKKICFQRPRVGQPTQKWIYAKPEVKMQEWEEHFWKRQWKQAIKSQKKNDQSSFHRGMRMQWRAVSTKTTSSGCTSHATATCHVFVDEPLFDTVQATVEDKWEQISPNKTQTKGKGTGNAQHETRKGRNKGVYAGLDFSFDAQIPFWCKYISVHGWRHNIQVKQALKQESKAQTRMEEG